MPLVQASTTIAAGAVNDNVLSGSQFEFLPYDAALAFGFTADATNGGNARIDVYSGQDVLCEGLVPSLQARTPVFPDDFNLDDVAAAGERIKIRIRNIGASGTITFYYALKITPV